MLSNVSAFQTVLPKFGAAIQATVTKNDDVVSHKDLLQLYTEGHREGLSRLEHDRAKHLYYTWEMDPEKKSPVRPEPETKLYADRVEFRFLDPNAHPNPDPQTPLSEQKEPFPHKLTLYASDDTARVAAFQIINEICLQDLSLPISRQLHFDTFSLNDGTGRFVIATNAERDVPARELIRKTANGKGIPDPPLPG